MLAVLVVLLLAAAAATAAEGGARREGLHLGAALDTTESLKQLGRERDDGKTERLDSSFRRPARLHVCCRQNGVQLRVVVPCLPPLVLRVAAIESPAVPGCP